MALKKIPVILFCLFLFQSIFAQKNDFAVVAYYAGGPDQVKQYKVEQLTHIIFSFCHLKGNELHVNNAWDTATIRELVRLKERNPQLKVMVSLGGWSGCATCSDVFSTENGREEFAQSVKGLLQYFKIDGIDLDWEYPVIEGFPGHTFSPEDKPHFTALVQSLRKTLPDKSVITFAAGGFQKYLDESIDWQNVMKEVDFVNLMTYDLVNGYATVTGHHTPLYSTYPEMESIDRAVKSLIEKGVSKDQIVIGAAFFGRIWENVPDTAAGLYQTGKFLKSISYKQIVPLLNTDKNYKQYWDSAANAPYLYNRSLHYFLTYDNKRSIRLKTQYAIDMGLRGIMFWQLTEDVDSDGLLQEIYETKMASFKRYKNAIF